MTMTRPRHLADPTPLQGTGPIRPLQHQDKSLGLALNNIKDLCKALVLYPNRYTDSVFWPCKSLFLKRISFKHYI